MAASFRRSFLELLENRELLSCNGLFTDAQAIGSLGAHYISDPELRDNIVGLSREDDKATEYSAVLDDDFLGAYVRAMGVVEINPSDTAFQARISTRATVQPHERPDAAWVHAATSETFTVTRSLCIDTKTQFSIQFAIEDLASGQVAVDPNDAFVNHLRVSAVANRFQDEILLENMIVVPLQDVPLNRSPYSLISTVELPAGTYDIVLTFSLFLSPSFNLTQSTAVSSRVETTFVMSLLGNLSFYRNVQQNQDIEPKASLLDTNTLRFTFAIERADLPDLPQIAIYRSPMRSYSPSAEILVGPLTIPDIDDSRRPNVAIGNHRVSMKLDIDLKQYLNGSDTFLLLVIDPPQDQTSGKIPETDENDNSVVLGEITAEQFEEVFGASTDFPKYRDDINLAFREFGILTTTRQAAFLSQVYAETNGLREFAENRYNSTVRSRLTRKTEVVVGKSFLDKSSFYYGHLYYGRFENRTEDFSDGFRFRGGGALHLTFRYNYRKASERLGFDLVKSPDMIRNLLPNPDRTSGLVPNPNFDSTLAFRVAGWFFAEHEEHRAFPIVDSLHIDFDHINASRSQINATMSELTKKVVGRADPSVSVRINVFNKCLHVFSR
ncbi:MAG: hypothetical protein R3E01_36515 [Pirellulaceae bacterium]